MPIAESESDQDSYQTESNETPISNEKTAGLFWCLFTVFCVALSAGFGSQLKYSLLNANPTKFYPPFTVIWFNACCLLICFPTYVLYERIKTKESVRTITRKARVSSIGRSPRKFLAKTVFFLELSLVINYAHALSLGRISSSATLTILSFETALVYLLSRICLNENLSWIKTLAVVLSAIGVILIALDREFAADKIGVLFILAACILASFYKVYFKKLIGNVLSDKGEVMFFLSCMGAINLLNSLPISALIYFNIDVLHWDYIPWPTLIGFILLTFVYNMSTAFGVILFSPLVISIGMLASIPLSIGVDLFYRNRVLTSTYVIGTALLALALLLVVLHEDLIRIFRKTMNRRRGNAEGENAAHQNIL